MAGARTFSLFKSAQTSSWAHLAPGFVCTGVSGWWISN